MMGITRMRRPIVRKSSAVAPVMFIDRQFLTKLPSAAGAPLPAQF
jgi:hypothetical protein